MIDPKIKKALDKAKINLMIKGSVFLTTITFSLKHIITTDIPTAATNGVNLLINPDFFMGLDPEERIGLLAHESWHVAFDHLSRLKDRDHTLWNMAGDYVINLIVTEAGMKIPPDGLLDKQYKDMSTEQIYDKLIEDPPPQKQQSEFVTDIIPADGDKSKEVDAQIKEILVKAVTQSRMANEKAGTIPSDVERAIDELINPILPWRDLLNRFLTERVKEDYSWRKPNKRFMPDTYLPTQYSESIPALTIAIDTSGSINADQLKEILSEIEGIRNEFNPQKLTIIDCDCRINNVYEVDEDTDILELKFTGGGGTSFEPVIEYCNTSPTTALLYFTDLYANQIKEEPEYPVLWLCYSDAQEAPIGETIYYN